MKKPLFTKDGRLLPSFDYRKVLEAVDKAATTAGRKAVAQSVGYSYEQLRRITDPEPNPDEVRHLRLDKFMEITEATGDVRGLEALCLEFGLHPMPVGKPEKQIQDCSDLMHAVLQAGENAGKLAQLAREAVEDNVLTAEERRGLVERIMTNIRFLSSAAIALGGEMVVASDEDTHEPAQTSPVGYIQAHTYRPGKVRPDVVLVPNETVERKQ